jgi:hypothetical protein
MQWYDEIAHTMRIKELDSYVRSFFSQNLNGVISIHFDLQVE